MPTYEYRCKDCGHMFELFQSMTDDPVSTCPECKGPVERLIGAGAGIIFKGSGFYSTDYRNDAYRKAAEKDKKGSGGTSESKSSGTSVSPAKTTTSSGK